jgi:UrcA family protein
MTMKNYTARIADIAGVATLALALLPVAALSTAHAANASVPYAAQSVQVSDLNLASASGKAMLAQRADAAARHFCRDERSLDAKAACQAGVRAEVSEKASSNLRLASRI